MKPKVTAVVILTMLISFAFGQSQFNLLQTYLYVDGVSNDGTVYGSRDWDSPLYIWDPDTGQFSDIGGISGNSEAHCSADGNYVSGAFYEQLPAVTGIQPEVQLTNNRVLSSIYHRYIYRSARFAHRLKPSIHKALSIKAMPEIKTHKWLAITCQLANGLLWGHLQQWLWNLYLRRWQYGSWYYTWKWLPKSCGLE